MTKLRKIKEAHLRYLLKSCFFNEQEHVFHMNEWGLYLYEFFL